MDGNMHDGASEAGILRWALDWAWVGAATSALAPMTIRGSMGIIPEDYPWVAGALGASSGLVVGALLGWMYRAVPERSRVAVLGVLTPLPLGAWGASVAAVAAFYTAPSMVGLAFFLGSFVAIPQMMWLIPVYTACARRGWQLAPILLATVAAPAAAYIGVTGFFTLTQAL